MWLQSNVRVCVGSQENTLELEYTKHFQKFIIVTHRLCHETMNIILSTIML